jgi:micrococcal nuclease
MNNISILAKTRETHPGRRFFPLFFLGLIFLALLPLSPAWGSGKVIRVIDGDSIVLDNDRRVRLLGINSPERREPYHHKARRFLESRLLNREVRLEFDEQEKDGYDRLLAYVYRGRSFINEELVREGLAHVMTIVVNRKYEERLLRAQSEAKAKRKGIWSVWGKTTTLKITSLHPYHPKRPAAYLRIVCVADRSLNLAGYVLTNEGGQRFIFPRLHLPPGHSVIVSLTEEGNREYQHFLTWPEFRSFHPEADTAFLLDPQGRLIDQFHYSERRRKTRSPR